MAKVNKDTGAIEYIAGGLRTPNGINFGPGGRLLVTDNQGGWVPTSKLVEIKPGGFYNMFTTFRDPITGASVPGRFDNQPVTPPVVWMPHNEIANSPSTPVVMEEGLFAGQLAIGDVTYGGLQRVFLEEVDGKLQGALYRMTQGLEAGINEVAVGPDGDLYLGGIGYDGNWNQPGKLRYGFQKLRANDTVTMDILKTEITETGFKLTYTKPLSRRPARTWPRKYQAAAVALQRHRRLRRPEARPGDPVRHGRDRQRGRQDRQPDGARRQARPRGAPPLAAAVRRRRRRGSCGARRSGTRPTPSRATRRRPTSATTRPRRRRCSAARASTPTTASTPGRASSTT